MPSKPTVRQFLPLTDRSQVKPNLGRIDVPVEEWGQMVTLQQMSARDSMAMTAVVKDRPDDGLFIILGYSLVNPESGQRIYGDMTKPEELKECREALMDTRLGVLHRLQRIALVLNSHGVAAAEKVRDAANVDEAAEEVAGTTKKTLGEAATAASPTS